MIRNILLAFALGITTFTFAQETQNIEATYIDEMILDYDKVIQTIPQQHRSLFADALKAEIEAGIFMTYHLKSNGNISSFKLEEKVNNEQGNTGFIAQQIAATNSKPYYKDLSSTPTTYYKEVDTGAKQYLIKESPDFKWKITREKSEIAGFKVTKAEGIMLDSVKVTAWYAPEITIKDGPATLSGLPGLIIKAEYEVDNTKMISTLKELKITDKDLKIKLPTKGNIVSEKEFMEEMKALQKQIQEMMNSGVDTK